MRARIASGALVAGALALYAGLAVATARYNSGTYDEASHLPAGYTYWTRGDFRLNPEHPPLVKELAALPLLLLPVKMEDRDGAWEARRQWEFGRRFLYHWNDADRLLLAGRLPIVALGVCLGMLVFLWARRLAGSVAAGAALFLFALSPEALAHGSLVTTDMGIALFGFASVAALERLRDGVTAEKIAALAAAVAMAMATKFSALLLLPILAVLAVLVAADHAAPRRRKLGGAAVIAAAVVAATLAVLWACYGFHFAASPDGRAPLAWEHVEPASPWLRAAAEQTLRHHLLPEAFVYGFLRFYKASDERPAFLLGETSPEGFWYYFPVTLALKTPLPLLILLVGAAFVLRERRQVLFLWIPPLLYLALVMAGRLNIGHRHLLPMHPFLFIAAGTVVALAARRGPGPRAAVGLLLAWYAVGTLLQHPHHLAHFNEAAGGPRQGYRHLVDSNLDWGQDLTGLKRWMDANGVARVKLSYFGTAEPAYYGIHADRLPGHLRPAHVVTEIAPGDVVAVSATHLQGLYLDDEGRRILAPFRAQEPIARAGRGILIFRASGGAP